MAKLASLVVDLQLQSAELRKGLDEANRRLEAFAKQTERTANVIEGVFTFDVLKEGLVSLATFVKGGADAADQMGELAESIGVPVEALSRLSYAAAFSGSSTEGVGKALAKTAGLMAKALQPTSEQAAMFQALGVSVAETDGRLRATEDVFADIAQRFAETSDGSAKTALAMRLFGDEGAKLVPLLNNGKAGLAAFGAEAERTGNVITEKGSASAGQFNDALDRLAKAGEGLAARVAQDLAPSMAALADNLTSGTGSAQAFETAATALAGAIRVLASAGVAVVATFEAVGQTFAGIGSSVANLVSGDLTAANESTIAAGVAIRRTLKTEGERFKAIWGASGPGATMASDAEKAKPSADAYLSAMERTKQAAAGAAEAQKKLAEASRKAAEESAKALDEYVKAALSLERQQQAVERAVEKRRAEASGALATDGFADMEKALQRMEEAQKKALALRSSASEMEKGGDLLGADRALREADGLDAMAERASAAVDAFQSMEAAAIEAAIWLDRQAVELGNRFSDIDREVSARRETMADPDKDPTAGFESFNAALDAMAEALKAEAELRSDAAMLERDGEVAAARQALLAAEATKALAETASVAADALAEMDAAAAGVPSELGGMLTGGMGAATSATLQGVETGAAAGPVGAVVGGLVGLLSQSEQFQGALDALEEIFQALANSVGKLVEPVLPLLTVVSEVAAGLGALLGALSPIVEFVARPLFEVLKAFGMIALGLIKFVGEIVNSIAQAFGGEGLNLKGIDEAMARLESASYGSAKAQQEVAQKAREVAGSINTVSWWLDSAARLGSVEPGRGGGSTVVNDNSKTTVVVNGVTDPEKVADKVDTALGARKTRKGGNGYRGDDKTGDEWVP
jgi:hypothetical protein